MQVKHCMYFTHLCTLLTFWVYTPLLYQNMTFCTKLHHSSSGETSVFTQKTNSSSSHFSQELSPRRLKLYHEYRIRLLLLIHPFISSFFFLSNFQTGCYCLFVPLLLHFSFSPIFKHQNVSLHCSQELWGLEDWNLVYMWTGQMYRVYRNQAAGLICPFISSFFFLSSFIH